MNFLMVIMASGIARGRVLTTTTTTTQESRNMAAILWILGWPRHAALLYLLNLWYCTSMLWSTDTCQKKASSDQYHVTISRPQVEVTFMEVTCFFEVDRWSRAGFLLHRAHVRLTCWKLGRIVRKPVNAGQGLQFIRFITFSSIEMILADLFWVYGDYKTQTESQTVNRKPHRKP